MAEQASLETFRQAFADFSQDTMSVYVPRPSVETGGEKWRILRKNVIDTVKDHGPKSDFITNRLEHFDLPDFRGNGIALFDDGKQQRMAHLNARPVACITTGEPPFILPLLADFQSRETRWVLHVTKDEPKLYLYSGGYVSDMSDRLDAPKYRSVEARRHVQDDVFFHSGSRGSVRDSDSKSVHHALGSDQSREREKTDDAFYHDTFNAVTEALPPQTSSLHIIGEEGTVGRFAQVASHGRFEITQHHCGGTDNVEDKIIAVFQGETAMDEQLPEGRNLPDLQSAAASGQLGTLYVPIEHAQLEEMHEQADEHLKLRTYDEADVETEENRTAVLALANGADIHWYAASDNDAVAELRADMRW
ncbi:hypothetical protein [Henriciella pelagia]|uniref:Uncharacterized protein n=1 Tax=Henriciella pelagia TaxID=1977912 RepID=A0ABQ1JWS9_9PROT|nr:hypothetical protein [Henriciella pelagia]GGB77682.1 hypothetical protein GCM10011503_28060 [Henriciella pelagia]